MVEVHPYGHMQADGGCWVPSKQQSAMERNANHKLLLTYAVHFAKSLIAPAGLETRQDGS